MDSHWQPEHTQHSGNTSDPAGPLDGVAGHCVTLAPVLTLRTSGQPLWPTVPLLSGNFLLGLIDD